MARAVGSSPAPIAAVLCGPTASGKTDLALQLASRLSLEIISADSRQVYRHLDIGTAKPTAAERDAVPHHLVDFLALDETYNAARFAADAWALCAAIRARGRLPLVVGGAGFYLQVLQHGLFEAPFNDARLREVRAELSAWSTPAIQAELERRDPRRAAVIHAHDRYRLARALEICVASDSSVTALTAARRAAPPRFATCRLQLPRATLHHRIATRATHMLSAGWIEEVQVLLAAGTDACVPGLHALGYPHVVAYLQGRLTRDRLEERIVRDTRRFARHQETWFRKAGDALALEAGAAENAAFLAAQWLSLVPGTDANAATGAG